VEKIGNLINWLYGHVR